MWKKFLKVYNWIAFILGEIGFLALGIYGAVEGGVSIAIIGFAVGPLIMLSLCSWTGLMVDMACDIHELRKIAQNTMKQNGTNMS